VQEWNVVHSFEDLPLIYQGVRSNVLF